jgi:hydroxyacylglutathione hydrolase
MAKILYRALAIAPFGTNCYIVGSEKTHDGMVIDPAGDAARILKNINELELKIGIIVLTHTHPDHIGAIGQVKKATGASFAVHSAEAPMLRRYDYAPWAAYDPSFEQPPIPDRLLEDGDTITVGDLTFNVLHTPGHSVGGICIEGYGLVFSGDTLFQLGIGRTDGPGGDYEELIQRIRNKLLVLPEKTVVLPGHGGKSTIGQERLSNPFLK